MKRYIYVVSGEKGGHDGTEAANEACGRQAVVAGNKLGWMDGWTAGARLCAWLLDGRAGGLPAHVQAYVRPSLCSAAYVLLMHGVGYKFTISV
jgi:hypothetical protein